MPIVSAVGTACGSQLFGPRSELSQLKEAAMQRAVLDAMAAGVDLNDSVEIKARMMAAYDSV